MAKGKKQMKFRSGARTASKAQERDLVNNARKLAKDPELILPKCTSDCRKCPFTKSRKQIERILRFVDDEKALGKFAKKGDQLSRAYAATLLLAVTGKAPYLAVGRYPFGDVAYAHRGSAKREVMIGIQHFDDPKWRMFSVNEVALKNKVNIFATKDGLVCRGHLKDPPDGFLKEVLRHIKRYNFKRDGKVLACTHLSSQAVSEGKPQKDPYLKISWVDSSFTFGICRRCASDKECLFGSIGKMVATPRPKDLLNVDIVYNLKHFKKGAGNETSEPLPAPKISSEDLHLYTSGGMSDKLLVEATLEKHRESLRESDDKIYVLDDVYFGDDVAGFISALNPTPEERLALEAVLPEVEGAVVSEKATPGRILTQYWEEHGKTALLAMVDDEQLAEEIYESVDVKKTAPSNILQDARLRLKRKGVISMLPTYEHLPTLAKFADDVARTYRIAGKDETLREVEKYGGGDTKIKSTAYAFLLNLGKAEGSGWRFTDVEKDFAVFLKDFTEELLQADPKGYDDALRRLLTASGSTEQIE